MVQQSLDNYPFPPVIELLSVDSTNNYALSLLKQPYLTDRQEKEMHGTAVFAHEQFSGKGQRGKVWHSKKGENIHLSVIIDPKGVSLQQQFLLIAVTAIAVRNFFDSYAQSDIVIKWPNDIYFKDRKAGGILIENIISGSDWKWAVAGVGLNINQTGFDAIIASKAVSLKQITGKSFNCLELALQLKNTILQLYNNYKPDEILNVYNQHLYKKNASVQFEKDGKRFKAIVKEVLPNGQLLVNTGEASLCFDFGEVLWL